MILNINKVKLNYITPSHILSSDIFLPEDMSTTDEQDWPQEFLKGCPIIASITIDNMSVKKRTG